MLFRSKLMPTRGFKVLSHDNTRLRPAVDVGLAANMIFNYAMSAEQCPRGPLPKECKEWLDWGRIAAEWLKHMEAL